LADMFMVFLLTHAPPTRRSFQSIQNPNIEEALAAEYASVASLRLRVSRLERAVEQQRQLAAAAQKKSQELSDQGSRDKPLSDRGSRASTTLLEELADGLQSTLALDDERAELLKQALFDAAAEAWQRQAAEAKTLSAQLTQANGDKGAQDEFDIDMLFDTLQEADSFEAANTDTGLFRLFESLPFAVSQEDEAEGIVLLPSQGIICSPAAARQRLDVLQDHLLAGCVEYRMFAAALASGSHPALASLRGSNYGGKRVPALTIATLILETVFGGLSLALPWGGHFPEETTIAEGMSKPPTICMLRPWLRQLRALAGSSSSGWSPFQLLVLLRCLQSRSPSGPAIYCVARMLARLNTRTLTQRHALLPPSVSELDQSVSRLEASLDQDQISATIFATIAASTATTAVGVCITWQLVASCVRAFAPQFGAVFGE